MYLTYSTGNHFADLSGLVKRVTCKQTPEAGDAHDALAGLEEPLSVVYGPEGKDTRRRAFPGRGDGQAKSSGAWIILASGNE